MVDVWPIPIFDDNYVWVIGVDDASPVIVVDPGAAAPVTGALAARGKELAAILVTHHHADHTGGAAELAARASCPVFGPAGEDIPAVDRPLREGSTVAVAGLRLEVIEVPGHTRGHLAYVGHGLLLAGDTLFAGGCGRVFEGTPREMWGSLDRLAGLPGGTALYCGHEYTVGNLRFAVEVEPGNDRLLARLQEATAARHRGAPTLPSTIAEERATNPFLRTGRAEIRRVAERFRGAPLTDDVQVFAAIRAWKDGWRG